MSLTFAPRDDISDSDDVVKLKDISVFLFSWQSFFGNGIETSQLVLQNDGWLLPYVNSYTVQPTLK